MGSSFARLSPSADSLYHPSGPFPGRAWLAGETGVRKRTAATAVDALNAALPLLLVELGEVAGEGCVLETAHVREINDSLCSIPYCQPNPVLDRP